MTETILPILYIVIAFLIGFLCGIWWLRYQIKNRPEKLAEWSEEVRDAVNKAKRETLDALNNETDILKARYDALKKDLENMVNRFNK